MKLPKEVSIERELTVWSLRQKMWTQERIANALQISQPAVALILKRLCIRYQTQNLEEIEHIKIEQISRLEFIADEAIQAWECSKTISQSGDPRYLVTAIKAQEDIRKIIGLEARMKSELTRSSALPAQYADLSDNELLDKVEAILDQARNRRDAELKVAEEIEYDEILASQSK